MESNLDGYKMIFFLENLLRDYVAKYYTFDKFPKILIDKATKTAEGNGDFSDFRELLNFLHLGELIDFCKSRDFRSNKPNTLHSGNFNFLIINRNTIMHSRLISWEQIDKIQEACTELVNLLHDSDIEISWNKFIHESINDFTVPEVFVEYPLGKDFVRLIGRDDALKELKSIIKLPTPVSVIRHGGLGKTALVLQLIIDLMYAPDRPFERIFFMSFKNTVFENGRIRQLSKVISNHDDLIRRLAFYMGIEQEQDPFDQLESKVWNDIFATTTLLVLDNLESAVVRTNLSEFIDIADRFIRNFASQSRLIITSRYGLGDREQKFPVFEFRPDDTKLLVESTIGRESPKLKRASADDWEWVQNYTKGNPGLIISFCYTLKTTLKSITDLRIEYNTRYTEESRSLHDNLDSFLEFCFENTIDSLPEKTQIFQVCIAYICVEVNIREIGSDLLSFLIEELNLGRLGDEHLRANILENGGFLQRISGSDKYYVNDLFVEYLNGNYTQKENVITIFSLRNTDLYKKLEQIISDMNDIQFDNQHSTGQILSKIFQNKFKVTGEKDLLLKSFLSDPSIENLIQYYSQADPIDIFNNFPLLDKIKGPLQQKVTMELQERLSSKIIQSLSEATQLIQDKKLKIFRQPDLIQFFEQLEKRMWIFKNNSFSAKLRESICLFLMRINQLDRAESYLIEHELTMPDVSLQLYSKFVGELAGTDRERCLEYILKCEPVLQEHNSSLSETNKARFLLYSSRYYLDDNPELAFELVSEFDKYSRSSPTLYTFYLESLLVRAQSMLKINHDTKKINELVERFQSEARTDLYKNKVWPKKRESFDRTLKVIERNLYTRH